MFVYGHQTWTDATGMEATILGVTSFYPGWNSCARTATAILKQGGVRVGIMNGVRDVERTLAGMGWKRLSETAPVDLGDVVIWAKGNLNHIGIYVGWRFCNALLQPCTMDNYSLSGRPEVRPLHRERLNLPVIGGWAFRVALAVPR